MNANIAENLLVYLFYRLYFEKFFFYTKGVSIHHRSESQYFNYQQYL